MPNKSAEFWALGCRTAGKRLEGAELGVAFIFRKGSVDVSDIKGLEGRTTAQVADELGRGGKFVYFPYVYSVLVMSFKRSSPIFYIPPGESALAKGLPYILISLCVGWWGFPWGIIWTFQTLFQSLSGGKDVTSELAPIFLGQAKAGGATVTPEPAPAVAAPAAGHVRWIAGPLTGQRWPVPAEGVYIGQNPGGTGWAVPRNLVAAQHHCWIGPNGQGGLTVVDMGSATGTFLVNSTSSQQVQQSTMQPGDMLYLGGEGGPVLVFEG